MFKKLLIASAVLAASTSAFAVGNWGPGTPYVGASVANQTITSGGIANYRGFSGNLNIGYGGMFAPCFYLGGELFGIPGSATYQDNYTNKSTKATWGWGGSLNPGWYLSDKTMLYGRAGGAQYHFNGPNVNKGAWLVGAGMQTNVYPCLDIRGEYVYSQASKISNVGTPKFDTFNAGIVYKIA